MIRKNGLNRIDRIGLIDRNLNRYSYFRIDFISH